MAVRRGFGGWVHGCAAGVWWLGDVTVYGEVYRQMVDRDGVRVLRWDGRYRRYNVINFQGAINE
jgi:hypothetical protein